MLLEGVPASCDLGRRRRRHREELFRLSVWNHPSRTNQLVELSYSYAKKFWRKRLEANWPRTHLSILVKRRSPCPWAENIIHVGLSAEAVVFSGRSVIRRSHIKSNFTRLDTSDHAGTDSLSQKKQKYNKIRLCKADIFSWFSLNTIVPENSNMRFIKTKAREKESYYFSERANHYTKCPNR